ncbi:MAG: LOG family protein [Gammaproteobacteria bacterium]|nr:LOG family protein [Gammaproteobacteria bacterium]
MTDSKTDSTTDPTTAAPTGSAGGGSVKRPLKAYENERFLSSRDARALRILAEYLEPLSRFERQQVNDTIVFLGSARTPSREAAEAALRKAREDGFGEEAAQRDLRMSRYYEAARELAHRFTLWSKGLGDDNRRFVVCTGGGPGIMEAANRGASEARGVNVGLTISIPVEEFDNRYITHGLGVHFHYFFMRKFWFLYMAKAVLVFPGGFGTLDELFEILTLVQTGKIRKRLPIVLFGSEYWSEVVDFDALVRHGTISPGDQGLFHRTDCVEDAFEFITRELIEYNLDAPGPTL